MVPFHLWTPDVYEGAPAPVTAFVATVSKGAMFALLLRYFYNSGAHSDAAAVFVVFAIIAVASMFAGNLLALLQNNVKRILAYSSIAHLGYLLVAFLAAGDLGAERRGVLPGGLLRDHAGRLRRRHGALRAARARRRPTWRTTAGSSGAARAGRRLHRHAAFAGRHPATAGFVGKFYVVAAGALRACGR